ncbi:MAG: DUF4184 family protein [Tannerellaceae bacterium]|nr:DUF4184 family protein [Tannerellaceae bacterium]
MPFTFSHPSIIVPFLYIPRKWVSITGLVVGSVAPDFEYFLRMRMKSEYSHTWEGILGFDLPVCLLIAFVFHLIVRNPLIDHLPRFLRERFVVYKLMKWNRYFRVNWMVVMCSFLIGIVSHLLWDSFTHPNGYFAQQIPFLQSTIGIGIFSFSGTSLTQKISGVVGGGTLLWLVLRLPRQKIQDSSPVMKYWLVVAGSAATLLFLRWLSFPRVFVFGHFIVAGMSAVLFSLVIAGLVFRSKFINKPDP